MNLSTRIAEHISSAQYAQLSSKAVQMTKYSLLDALGVMIGASGIGEGCDAFAQLAMESKAKPEAVILGYRQRTSASLAALVNGSMAHALDFEDAHDGGPVHPNAQVIPAALALAESIEDVEGPELITAIAVGCDLACRLAMCLTAAPDQFGWYPPPILGAFGATATAARLMRLDARQTLDALSLTLNQISFSAEVKYNPDSLIRSIRDSFAAQTGVVSAQLASRNLRGFDQPFEGKAGFFNNFTRGHFDENVLLDGLGVRFEGENVSFKPWPACRGTHAYIDASLELQKTKSIKSNQIARGKMKGSSVQRMLFEPVERKRKPSTAIDAKFSLPFTVASSLVHGDVNLSSYSPASLGDQQVLNLASRLDFEVDADHSNSNATRGTLELELNDGQTYSLHIENPKGHPSRPMSESDLIAKFKQCAGLGRNELRIDRCHEITECVLSIETSPDSIKRLFRLLQE